MKQIDFSKPLSEEDEAYLRQRLPNEQVDHLKARAAGESEDSTRMLRELVDPDGALQHSQQARTGDTTGGTTGDTAVMQEGDDPADFNVGPVNTYLESASDEEKERVLQAERDGKNRSSIVGS